MKLLHVTIQTENFEKEMEFYQKYVGLSIVKDLRPMGKDIVFLSDGEDATNVEIINESKAENTGNEFLSVGFHAEDLKGLRERLMNDEFDVSPMISPMPGFEFFFVTDPAGIKVQFV